MRYKISKDDFIGFLKKLLEKEEVSEILSGEGKRNRYTINPKFISEKQDLTDFPLSQLMVYNYNSINSAANKIRMSGKSLNQKIAIIGHACDVRALIELDKKKQADFDNLFLISFEDAGYIGGKDKRMFFRKTLDFDEEKIVYERLTQKELILKLDDGNIKKFELGDKIDINKNCRCCSRKSHPAADVLISTYALPEKSEEFILTPNSTKAELLIEDMKWDSKKVDGGFEDQYSKIAQSLMETCEKNRLNDYEDWKSKPVNQKICLYDTCVGCGMCVRSCPVCFCKSCNIHEKLKAKEIDQRTFLITRFAHVGDTCISCGKCEVNCPVNIPLTSVFREIQAHLKERREYEAGKDRKQKVFSLDF